MSSYSNVADTEFFLAGRDAARYMRGEGVVVTAANAETWCPRGLHAADEAAWLRGWKSVWA